MIHAELFSRSLVAVLSAVFVWQPAPAQTGNVQGMLISDQPPDADTRSSPSTGDAYDLAKQLANPVASLISVPFQIDDDTDLAETDADRWALNVQPVIPYDLSEGWTLISRTIVPLVDLKSPVVGGDDVSDVSVSEKIPRCWWLSAQRSKQ